jgi:hypothetical protein
VPALLLQVAARLGACCADAVVTRAGDRIRAAKTAVVIIFFMTHLIVFQPQQGRTVAVLPCGGDIGGRHNLIIADPLNGIVIDHE